MSIKITSNVYVIQSGVTPTIVTLPEGCMAFGKMNSDGKYHLFANSDGTIQDLVLDSQYYPTIDDLVGESTPEDTRELIGVYSKAEIDNLIAAVFTFRGELATLADLDALEDVRNGDVYQVTETGKLHAWDGDEWHMLGFILDLSDYYTKGEIGTIVSGLETRIGAAEDEIVRVETELSQAISAAKTNLEGQISDLEDKVNGEINDKIAAVEESVEDLGTELRGELADKATELTALIETKVDEVKDEFDAVIVTNGTGKKFLADDGVYYGIEAEIIKI